MQAGTSSAMVTLGQTFLTRCIYCSKMLILLVGQELAGHRCYSKFEGWKQN